MSATTAGVQRVLTFLRQAHAAGGTYTDGTTTAADEPTCLLCGWPPVVTYFSFSDCDSSHKLWSISCHANHVSSCSVYCNHWGMGYAQSHDLPTAQHAGAMAETILCGHQQLHHPQVGSLLRPARHRMSTAFHTTRPAQH